LTTDDREEPGVRGLRRADPSAIFERCTWHLIAIGAFMRKNASAPPLAIFRTQFLRVLEGYYRADPLIGRILKDNVLQQHCAALLWFTVNDARERLTRESTRRRDFLVSALDDAIRGAKALEFVYAKLDPKPHLAEYLSTLHSDLLVKRQAVDTAFVNFKAYGRDRDWSAVRYAKYELERRLQISVPNATLADLLNAADKVAGRKLAGTKTELHEADVEIGLRRLAQRTFELILPFYKQILAEHYAIASDLSAA
jgi:hypothetical protein